jgi:Putative Se/S carrier protein-like
MKCVILFHSIHQVMRVEKILKGKGVQVDLIPVPREISSDCGVAVELGLESKEEALRLIEESNIPIVECYTRVKDKGFEKWN